MGRTPIRAKDSPGFIANRLARPFSLESLRMLGDGVADAATIDRVVPARRRLPDGPVRADRPDRPRRQPQRRPLLLRPGRRARALAAEPDPGADGRRRPARPQERRGLLRIRRGRPTASATPTSASRRRRSTRTSWPRSTRPRPRSSPAWSPRSPTRPPSRSKSRSARPQDMDTAMRLGFNWPLGPLEFAELIGVERAVELLEALQASTARPTAPPRPASPRQAVALRLRPRPGRLIAGLRGTSARPRSTSSSPRRARPSG